MNTKECNYCKKIFTKKPNESKKYWDKKMFCSPICATSSPDTRKKFSDYAKNRTNEHRQKLSKSQKNNPRSKEFYKEVGKYLKPQLGKDNYFYGIHKQPKEWIEKRTASLPKGEKHHNWKGGISTENDLERRKFQVEVRDLVLNRDGYKCQCCGNGGYLQVDHIQPWADYIELRFDINNCRTLCVKCHYKITYGREMPETTKTWGHSLPKFKGEL